MNNKERALSKIGQAAMELEEARKSLNIDNVHGCLGRLELAGEKIKHVTGDLKMLSETALKDALKAQIPGPSAGDGVVSAPEDVEALRDAIDHAVWPAFQDDENERERSVAREALARLSGELEREVTEAETSDKIIDALNAEVARLSGERDALETERDMAVAFRRSAEREAAEALGER